MGTDGRPSGSGFLAGLGIALRSARRFGEAVTAFEQDLVICREIGDRHGEAITLDNLGTTLQEIGRFEEAIAAHQEAAVIHREAVTITSHVTPVL